MTTVCSHLETIKFTELPARIEGCEECLKIGARWVHLRMCMECGKIGCCEDSPNRHASKHAHEVSHPIIRSAEPGEDWSWCYVDRVEFVL
jgi:uncharacterized UBP type Zn finger protein